MCHSRTLLCLSTLILSLSSFTIADDAAVMATLLAALSPTPSGWSASTSYCQWTKVTCDSNNRVTIIDLFSQNLSGILPSNLGSLTKLRSLSLQGNSFSGPLPSLANLPLLEQLHLDNNYFSSIPDGFFQGLTSLQYLFLSENTKLAPWTIPNELNQSTSLVTLDAGSANLFGSLPDIFGSFQNLTDLHLSFNNLTGPLPKSFGGSAIQNLTLDNQKNGLSGTIDVLSWMTQLKKVGLHKNQFTGPIPDLSNLKSLKNLSLNDNYLNDSIPDSLTTLPHLQLLDVSNNNLTGSISKFTSTVNLIYAPGNPLLGTTPPSSGSAGSQRLKAMIIALDSNKKQLAITLGFLTAIISMAVSLKPLEMCRLWR